MVIGLRAHPWLEHASLDILLIGSQLAYIARYSSSVSMRFQNYILARASSRKAEGSTADKLACFGSCKRNSDVQC